MGSRTGLKLNLTQALNVRDNWYRSSDNRRDYIAEEIDQRIIELQSKKAVLFSQKSLRAMVLASIFTSEVPPEIPSQCCEGLEAAMDWTLSSPHWRKDFSEECYINQNGGLIVIPPEILEF